MIWQRRWGLSGLVGVILGLFLMSGQLTGRALPVVHQKTQSLRVGRLRLLNDTHVQTWHQPQHYAHAKHKAGINTIRAVAGQRETFQTQYLLPQPGYHGQSWGNPQSMAIVGRYIYVVYCPTTWHNRGRIVRFDRRRLAGLHATPAELQRVYLPLNRRTSKATRQLTAKLRAAIKSGPAFETGHGQSLAYNWRKHHLYLWCDRERAPRVPTNQYGYLDQISPRTLRPTHQIRFRLRQGRFAVPGGHVLTFDHSNHAYFWTRPSAHRVYLYQGTISQHHVHFRLTHQVLRHGPGTRVQSIGYNGHNHRLYLVSDDSVASLPVRALRNRGHLTPRQIHWTGFGPRREFEALTFTGDGRAYLLCNHEPEILRGTRTGW